MEGSEQVSQSPWAWWSARAGLLSSAGAGQSQVPLRAHGHWKVTCGPTPVGPAGSEGARGSSGSSPAGLSRSAGPGPTAPSAASCASCLLTSSPLAPAAAPQARSPPPAGAAHPRRGQRTRWLLCKCPEREGPFAATWESGLRPEPFGTGTAILPPPSAVIAPLCCLSPTPTRVLRGEMRRSTSAPLPPAKATLWRSAGTASPNSLLASSFLFPHVRAVRAQ